MKTSEYKSLIIVTQIDPFYTLSFLREFLYIAKKDKKLAFMNIKIFNLPNFNESKINNLKRFLMVYGLLNTIKLTLKYFIEVYLLNKINLFKNYCRKNNIQFICIDSIKSNIFKSFLKNEKTCVLSLSCPQIFTENILNTKNIKFLNIHCAPLPSYKGMMPNFWQTINDEYSTGISLHEIDENIDTGNIISSFNYPLIKTTSLHEKMILAKLYSAHLFYNYLKGIEGLQEIKYKNNYHSFPKRKDGIKFRTNNKII